MNERKAFSAFVVLTFSALITDRILFVVFPNFLIDKNFSPSQIGLIFSIAAFILLLSRIFIGKISDIFGRKLLMVSGLIAQSFSISAYTFVNSLFSFSIVRGFQQISETLISTVEGALVGDLFSKKSRPKILTKLGSIYAIARTFAVIVGFIAVTYFSLLFSFYLAALAALFSAAIIYVLIKEPKIKKEKFSFIPSLFKYSRDFYKISIISFLQTFAAAVALSPAFFILARRLSMSEGDIFLYLLFSYVITSFVLYFLHKKKENLGTKRILFYSILVMSFSFGLYSTVTLPFHILFILPFITFTFYLWRIGFYRILIDLTNQKNRGEQIGFATTIGGLGDMIGPAVGGFTIEFISLPSAFIIAGITLFITSMMIRSMKIT